MSEKLKKYFNTGEFAKLCNIKKQTLFHYDDIGIFSPEIKDKNGYRYYSHHQFEIFNVIMILKGINMPLKDIKSYLDNRTPDSLINLFKNKMLEIDNEIENLNRIKKLMQTKIDVTQKACEINPLKISLEFKEEEHLIISKSIENVSCKEYLRSVSEHMKYCTSNKLNTSYSLGAMINSKNILQGVKENYSYLYTKIDLQTNCPSSFIKPKGIYAVAYHKGNYENIDSTYKKILSFLDRFNLNIGGYAYEEFILDEASVKGYNNYLTEISVEVNTK
ncbi:MULTISPECIES: MerR family transcriptional regulator [unclassified Clostridium]|uniref:MerR family transcriptional regulator n=1 Tax=unclassified Clostridium TaxID=2614128 RepID=UPI0013F1222D|nr:MULTISPECIES: MerR family transcriptional regulator [unclassified Clostridium]NFG61086.1 MerR family transcriptional regulator [Clostridium botulinum]NFQ08832.1 MerR family transcriptional regulator [Clostridium botulinum]